MLVLEKARKSWLGEPQGPGDFECLSSILPVEGPSNAGSERLYVRVTARAVLCLVGSMVAKEFVHTDLGARRAAFLPPDDLGPGLGLPKAVWSLKTSCAARFLIAQVCMGLNKLQP